MTAANEYITVWLLVNVGLSMVDMLMTMCFMIRLSYSNYIHFVTCLYILKFTTWICCMWGTAIIGRNEKILYKYYTPTMIQILKSMLLLRWSSMLLLALTIITYSLLVCCLAVLHVDRQ